MRHDEMLNKMAWHTSVTAGAAAASFLGASSFFLSFLGLLGFLSPLNGASSLARMLGLLGLASLVFSVFSSEAGTAA